MRKFRHFKAAAAVALCTAAGGCGLGGTVDSLMTPPMLSEGQEAIYTALENAAGKDISLVYPRSGAYRSAFVFYDMDGDGTDEAVVFYEKQRDSEGSVRVNILSYSENDGWRSVYDHAGAGTDIEQVFFTDLGGKGKTRMGIGYSLVTPTENAFRIYSFEDNALITEYSDIYYKLIRTDLDKDGGEDIAVINCNNENHGASAALVTCREDKAEAVSRVDLSAFAVDISSVVSGNIGSSTPALFIDSLSGNGTISTEVVYCVNGELRNPAVLENSELIAATSRANRLFCADIDGDGIVEIPSREPFPGYRDAVEMRYITVWNRFENYSVVRKYNSLTVPSKGYCFMLPGRWEGLVTVKNDSSTGEEVFYKFNSSLSQSRLELMRIAVCSPSEEEQKAAEGYFTVTSTSDAVYMAKLGDTDDKLLLTTSEITNNFYLY